MLFLAEVLLRYSQYFRQLLNRISYYMYNYQTLNLKLIVRTAILRKTSTNICLHTQIERNDTFTVQKAKP